MVEKNKEEQIQQIQQIQQPNFVLEKIPDIRIKSIRFKNYKAFDDCYFDFSEYTCDHYFQVTNKVKDFICFIGPNGSGKSTILNAVQLLFNRIEGRDAIRIKNNLGKSVRHIGSSLGGVYGEDDFLITAHIQSSLGDYEIKINKSGFISDHPQEIKEIVYRLCYFAKFDQQLNKFQLVREKWPIFKELYEAVTGFTIEENTDVLKYFGGSEDPSMKRLVEDYVLSFFVKKPHETINITECSDGERKIIKSFSTLLTVEYTPQIILVDNIEMHVERSRHFALIDSMKKCFPTSQIFSTTHSTYISRSKKEKYGIYDLRLIHSSEVIKEEPWRLCIIDEVNDAIIKLENCDDDAITEKLLQQGKTILSRCNSDINDLPVFKEDIKFFLKEVSEVFVNCIEL